jgi:dihydrolipoamide dehydrogenase
VACVDAWKNRDGSAAFGGTCLNAGCIPSKALLESSELVDRAQLEFATARHPDRLGHAGSGYDAEATRGIVRTMTGGVAALLKAAGVTRDLRQRASCCRGGASRSRCMTAPSSELSARHVVLASGSVPTELKSLPFDHATSSIRGMRSSSASVPKKLL